LKGSNCPHYDNELERRPAYHEFISSGEIQAGLATDDGVAIHFIDQEISKIVSSRPKAKAFRVFMDDTLIEQEMDTYFLCS
jgi:dipeptidase E